MSKRSDFGLLQDIKDCIENIFLYTRNFSYENFLKDRKLQDAVVRNLEIIGEATKNTSQRLKNKYKDIPWQKMARQRDKLIHHYAGVDYDVVWGIIEKSLPELIPKINVAISKESVSRR